MITIENLTYRYSKKKLLFGGLQLTLRPGGIYGLLGKNGAGKSTLMKIISGLLFPYNGSCYVNGLKPHQREVAFLEQMFFIPEECDLPKLSISRFTSIYAPFYPSFDQKQFSEFLTEFNIPDDAQLHQLSFGQKKKAFIAFGLATNTRLLVMDEPTNGLDIPSKVQFRKLMSRISNPNRVILISSHQVRDLDDLITSVIIMDNNRILLDEEKERIGQQLGFYYKQQATIPGEVLYEEQTPNGWVAMCRNLNRESSYIDLEILFNATLGNPGLIRSIFKSPVL